MKQTAVEYLFQQLWDTPKDKLTWFAILKQAILMEREQIEDAYKAGDGDSLNENIKDWAEEYYDKRFNSRV